MNLREAGGRGGPGILGWKVLTLESALVHTQEAQTKRLTKDPQQRLSIGLTLDSPMIEFSGMRFYLRGGAVRRTRHSTRLEFSSMTELKYARIS